MSDSRPHNHHPNSHLIVTVLSAWVALMCGLPAAQGAPAMRTAPFYQTAVSRVLERNSTAELPSNLAVSRTRIRSLRLISFSEFKPGSFFSVNDLAAILPSVDLGLRPATVAPQYGALRESTTSLRTPDHLRIVTRLPRAGIV